MRCNPNISILLVLFTVGMQAQVPDYTRHISRSFPVVSNMSVEITNKYGRVQIIPWTEDSVKFNIDLRIRAKDNQKLEKLKQNVEFEFIPGQYFVMARTKFGDSGSEVIKDIVDIAGAYLSSNNSVSINYTVMIPSRIPLKIENKFGNVYLDEYEGSLNLTLSYGNMKANRLLGRSEIKLSSGDGEINYLKEGQMYVSYGNIHVGDAGKLFVQTRSSNITIDKSASLKLDSRRDKLYLNNVTFLSGTSYFSNLNIAALLGDLNLTSRYGDIEVNNIHRSVSSIILSTELTDLALAFDKPLTFSLDLTHHQDVLFMYPKANASLKTKTFNMENKIFNTSGTIGTGAVDSEVIIKALRKCTITISQK